MSIERSTEFCSHPCSFPGIPGRISPKIFKIVADQFKKKEVLSLRLVSRGCKAFVDRNYMAPLLLKTIRHLEANFSYFRGMWEKFYPYDTTDNDLSSVNLRDVENPHIDISNNSFSYADLLIVYKNYRYDVYEALFEAVIRKCYEQQKKSGDPSKSTKTANIIGSFVMCNAMLYVHPFVKKMHLSLKICLYATRCEYQKLSNYSPKELYQMGILGVVLDILCRHPQLSTSASRSMKILVLSYVDEFIANQRKEKVMMIVQQYPQSFIALLIKRYYILLTRVEEKGDRKILGMISVLPVQKRRRTI